MTFDELPPLSAPKISRKPTRELPPPPIDSDLDGAQVDSSHQDDIDRNGLTESQSIAQSPVEMTADNSPHALSPLQAHYLKKSLISLQTRRELEGIFSASATPNVSTLSHLGEPFHPPPKGTPPLDLPFLKYAFRQFVMTFPFLSAAPKNFFPEKLQPFIASALSRNLSPTNVMDDSSGNEEEATRLKLFAKIEKHLTLLLSSSTKLVEAEEVVRLTQADLNRLETLAKKRRARQLRMKDLFEVNIVCIRVVTDKGRMRSKVHEEFIIRTRRSNFPDVFVSRRYGDFKTLADELRKMHPEEVVRSPPPKDRTIVKASYTMPGSAPSSYPPASPLSTSSASTSSASPCSMSSDSLPSQQAISGILLAREKNRLTLRAYLNSLLTSSKLASSPVLRSFLLSGPTKLSPAELEDAKRREDADHKREEGRIRFAREIAARVEGLRGAVQTVKGDIMAKDGLSRIFGSIRTTDNLKDLPREYQAVFEWGRISLASTIFHHFVASDDSSENMAGLKRIHGLMPYFMLKGILKISNPVAMIRGILELFLAQPFGGRSLLQRMFTSSLQEEVNALQEDIEAVQGKVEDPVICEKVRQFVYAPREIQAVYKADAAAEGVNLLTTVLRSGESPPLNRSQMHRVFRAHKAHAAYAKYREELADSDDDNGPEDDDAWLFEDLIILAKLYSQLRDKEQMIELIFEGTTAELLKDIITIFYSPLAQVYKAASIADSLGDLQNFINDLIRTVEQSEQLSQDDPKRIVQSLIDLVERHEQSFYSFVHKVHSKGQGLFDSLMHWIELFLASVREGLGEKISLEFLLPYTGPDRTDILKEIDAVALYHYKLKVLYEEKVRRRFGNAESGDTSNADAEDEAAQELVNGVVHDLSFGELVKGDVAEIAAEEDDEDDDEYESESDSDEDGSSEYETASESGSDSSGEETVELKPIARSATIAHPPHQQSQHQFRDPPRRSDSLSLPQQQPSRSHSHSQHHPQSRGRDSRRDDENKEPRSRSRSLHRIKSILSMNKKNTDAPPLPALPLKHFPSSPLPKHMSSSSSTRSSVESVNSQRRGPIQVSTPGVNKTRKRRKQTATLKPPELEQIPKLLPIFVEMMRPLLRPKAI